MKLLAFLVIILISGCSYCDVVVTTPESAGAYPGTISVNVNQGRKGLDSLMDGVQASVPLQGGTVSNPTNTTTENVKD